MSRDTNKQGQTKQAEEGPQGDDSALANGLLLPGGKVSEDALRALLERAEAEGRDSGEDEELRRVTFTLLKDLQKRLDKYLTDRIGFMSRTQLQRLIDEGGVLVNGRLPKASTVLRIRDVVEVVIPTPPPKHVVPEDIPVDVMFEDEHLIVLNKQPDIIVHPARSHLTGTMLSALAYHFKHRSASGGGLSRVGDDFARPGVVHRLDRHTSGCIVFAKQDEAHWKLGHQFEHRRVDKRYVALVHGRVEPDTVAIEHPLGPHPSREKGYREKQVVRHDELGKPALTICRVRERYEVPPEAIVRGHGPNLPSVKTDGRTGAIAQPLHFSLVELELKTGRTHQIRVHLSYNGFPIVGDDMYGGRSLGVAEDGNDRQIFFATLNGQFGVNATPKPTVDGGRYVIARQALHATILCFYHPVSNEQLRFTAPLRGDMLECVRLLRSFGKWERIEGPTITGATVDLDTLIP